MLALFYGTSNLRCNGLTDAIRCVQPKIGQTRVSEEQRAGVHADVFLSSGSISIPILDCMGIPFDSAAIVSLE
jgi:hypothetical protein